MRRINLPAPDITFRDTSDVLLPSTVDFGTVAVGGSSSIRTWRIWNNYAQASGIADATNCQLGAHDQGASNHEDWTLTPASGWAYVKNQSYDGGGTPDAGFTNVYSTNRLDMVYNGAVIGGSGAGTERHYWETQVKISVPSGATQGTKTFAICLKYSYT